MSITFGCKTKRIILNIQIKMYGLQMSLQTAKYIILVKLCAVLHAFQGKLNTISFFNSTADKKSLFRN